MMQTQTAIDPSLAALLQTAKMVTPDGNDTVAAQVAQAAQQKMQPQGIMQGMSEAREDFAAAAPSVMRNMQQEQMQGVVEQAMRPKPVGLEGLAAPNMETFAAAQGGVVGYAGPTGSEVEVDETKLPVDERFKRKLRSIYEAIETGYMQRAGATPEMIAKKLGKEPPVAPAPIPEGSDRRLDIPVGGIVSPGMAQVNSRPPIPAPRPPVPEPRPSAQPAPTGVAALASQPKMDLSRYEKAGAEDRAATEKIIAAQEANAAAKAAYMSGRPKFEQEGIAALTKANQAREELLSKERADDAYNRQQALLDQIGRRNTSAYSQEQGRQRQRDLLAAEAQSLYERAVIKQREAEFLQGAGRFEEAKKALDDKEKILAAMQTRLNQSRDTEARIAERRFASDVQMYEGAQNRDANRKLAEYNRQTQLMKPHEIQIIEGLKKDKLDELTGGKPETATAAQRVEATEFALQAVKGAGRAGGIDSKVNTAALRELGRWVKDEGENIKAMNAKNPKVFEDARRAKIREINATLGSTIPVDGGTGEEPPPNIKAILNKYGP